MTLLSGDAAARPGAADPDRRSIALALAVRAVPVSRRQGAQRRGQDLRHGAAGRVLRPAARLRRHRLLRPRDVLRHRRLWRRARALRARGRAGARWRSGSAAALALSLVLALAIGLFSLRVQAIFFAMVTLAVAYAFNVLASQLSDLTGGEDGRSFQVPEVLRPGFKLGRRSDLRRRGQRPAALPIISCSPSAAALFLALLRIVNSPFGRVLQAIRENPFRAEALGYRIVFHRTLATCISALGATLGGRARTRSGCATSAPTRRCRFSIQIDVLVIVVIGGMGTLYGAVHRRGAVRHRRELSAGADRRLSPARAADARPAAAAARCCTPTAGCCGSACCSCSRSISRRRDRRRAAARGARRRADSAPCRRLRAAPRRSGAKRTPDGPEWRGGGSA